MYWSRKLRLVVIAGCLAVVGWRSVVADKETESPGAEPKTAEGKEASGDKPKSEEPEPALADFMRKKLDSTNLILEGLCTDDLTLVKRGAKQLQELGDAERFRVSNDMMYRQFNAEFHNLTQDLIDAADEGNADRAALKWVDTTMNCLDCHRFVRGMRITKADR